MNYTSKDLDDKGRPSPRGEIWVRGVNVLPGYYKQDKKNEETFLKEGWLMSGDIGQLLPDSNALKIIDRKKNIFKLAQGEYIAPEKLETAYVKANPYINDIFVYGDSLKSFLVAVVLLEGDNINKLAHDFNIGGGDH